MPQRESSLERYLVKRVAGLGGMAIKITPTVAGVPDRLVLLPGGLFFLVELKTDTGSLRPAQRVWHRRAARIGHDVVTLKGRAEIKKWLDEIEEVMPDGTA